MLLFTTSRVEMTRVRLTEKVRRMAQLPPGWSHGLGVPVTGAAIGMAERLIVLASNLDLEADVFPNLDGGCAVAFYEQEERVEISISPDSKTFGLRAEHGIGFDFQDVITPIENASKEEIAKQISRLNVLKLEEDHIWKLYASSISDNSTETVNDFGMLSIKTHQSQPTQPLLQTEEGGSLSLKLLAPVLV